MAKKTPWYRDGLQFECTQCGVCCSGAPGFVWVNAAEIKEMARVMEMTDADFRHKFVRNEGSRHSLVEYPDGDCIFLDPKTRGCMVYEARPIQCRTWPFWTSNVQSKRAWEETCKECPGAGQGKLYDLEHIESERKRKRV